MPSYLVTGASSGIGLELVRQLLGRGDKVIATVRKRSSSQSKNDLITDFETQYKDHLVIIEGIDQSKPNCGEELVKKLESKPTALALLGTSGELVLDCVIHNAGSFSGGDNGDRTPGSMSMGQQSFDNVTDVDMVNAYEVNCIGPMRLQKALTKFVKRSSGSDGTLSKVAIVSTGLSSIADNGSGGNYAYRCSKAAVNMLGKCWAADLNKENLEKSLGGEGFDRKVAVALIAPGFIQTEFGPGLEAMTKWGAKPVDQAGRGIIKCLDDLDSLEKSGKFWSVRSADGEVVGMDW